MNLFKKNETPTPLHEAIASVYSEMVGLNADSEEYANCVDQLIKLEKLRNELNSSKRPTPDALITAGASIASVLLILQYEKLGHITSKALGFVGKMR